MRKGSSVALKGAGYKCGLAATTVCTHNSDFEFHCSFMKTETADFSEASLPIYESVCSHILSKIQ